MSNAKAQEYRIKKYFEDHPDIELIKYYGSRETKAGDFLIRMGGKQYRVDHKSTTSKNRIRLMKNWYPKLCGICNLRTRREGSSTPLFTLSILTHKTTWVLYGWPLFEPQPATFCMKPGAMEIGVASGKLYDIDGEAKVLMDGYEVFITTLDTYVREVLSGK